MSTLVGQRAILWAGTVRSHLPAHSAGWPVVRSCSRARERRRLRYTLAARESHCESDSLLARRCWMSLSLILHLVVDERVRAPEFVCPLTVAFPESVIFHLAVAQLAPVCLLCLGCHHHPSSFLNSDSHTPKILTCHLPLDLAFLEHPLHHRPERTHVAI